MCDKNCNGCGDCLPVGPPGPKGDKGDPGKNGTNGRGVLAQFVSDGVTPIGDVLYPLNTLVTQYTDLTYSASGVISIPSISWQDLELINGWTNGSTVLRAQYAIFGGFIYLRGRINFSASTSDTFANIASSGVTGTIYTSGSTDHAGPDIELDQEALITIDNLGNLSAIGASSSLDGSRLILDSIPPISIR